MTYKEKKERLNQIWDVLVEDLKKHGYVEVASCNADFSRYLVRDGEQDKITYFGKPYNSFRISDHWSWINNNKAPGEIQCCLSDARVPKEGEKPLKRLVIAMYALDDRYHFLWGERSAKRNSSWRDLEEYNCIKNLIMEV